MLHGLISAVRDVLGIGMRLHIDSEPGPHVVILVGADQWPLGELDGTIVRVRYDAGRPLADNGDDLARLLGELVAGWPVEVERLTLIGHSTAGLLARQSVTAAAWSGIDTRVICFTTSYADQPVLHTWSLRTPTEPASSNSHRIPYLDERDWLPIAPTQALTHPAPAPSRPDQVPTTRPAHWIGDLLVLPYQPRRTFFGLLRRAIHRFRSIRTRPANL